MPHVRTVRLRGHHETAEIQGNRIYELLKAAMRSNVSTRVVNRVALEWSRFDAARRHRGNSAALGDFVGRLRRSVAYRTTRGLRRLRPNNLMARLPLPDLLMQDDVLFIGYLEAALGLGESMRGLVRAVAATGLPFALYPFGIGVETRRIGGFMEHRYDFRGRHRVNVIEMAADQLPAMFDEIGRWKTVHSYNILRTYWELPRAPAEWASMLSGIHEIWVPNEFVGNAFRGIFDGPITIIPPCVEVETDLEFERQHFGLDGNIFYFTFSFDYFSYPARKNPLGVVRAFQAAFPDGDEKVGLVIKSTSNASHYPETKAAIKHAAGLDPRIKVIDHILSRDEMVSLIRQSDCYVSLHRSEGFGLGMAEALALGKPVIGTDYSGSTEFLSDRTGFPVDYSMRPLQAGEYICSDGQIWAEPDAASAAAAMQRVFRDRAERERRAEAGKALIHARYGREMIGRLATRRLRDVFEFVYSAEDQVEKPSIKVAVSARS
jgi:glycosyltransferase involved in cell wall biosynthesis